MGLHLLQKNGGKYAKDSVKENATEGTAKTTET